MVQCSTALYQSTPRKIIKWSVTTITTEDGRGNSIWDDYSHYWGEKNINVNGETRCNVDKCHTGDIACDSYRQWDRDLELLKNTNVKTYRFSLSWSRLLPFGTEDLGINAKGVDYYNKMIDDLLENNIIPFVTIYHWDLPSEIQNTIAPGGWINSSISDLFADYADFCFRTFGDRVKNWITLNEPGIFVDQGYHEGIMAPGRKGYMLEARFNTILAHVKAYRRYDQKYRDNQKGQVGITLFSMWNEPETEEERDLADLKMELDLGWWAEPIFGSGDFSSELKTLISDEGKTLSEFSEDQKKLNQGASDFFGLNHYTTRLVRSCDSCEYGFEEVECDSWPVTGSVWLRPVPWGFQKLLEFIHNRWDTKKYPLYVTENGASSKDTGAQDLEDQFRIDYYSSYVSSMKRAMKNGVNVKGYMAWSLMDNFEWARGYTERFGVHWVDFNDPRRRVYPKKSAEFLKKLFSSNKLSFAKEEL
ncbi:Oidioi.mRNA.OKI2018_I69.PAR.g12369.t1.cds [Oikopleura dioica]|uniref:beta-glucosidase n=1 Tax=Oikopleura dioica TaxID=34765 RepID=A0ABN7RZN4_OIKDI|nr:Oidioi.mRNA.OKI2018_I69.PAR.g12369.t1.cds [Oikopleura dioica]